MTLESIQRSDIVLGFTRFAFINLANYDIKLSFIQAAVG
jgi:hypothetical protein